MQPSEIRLCTQIRNASHSIDRWWNGLLKLNYPKDHITLDIIDDLSEDNTYEMLKQYQKDSPFKEFTVKRPTDFPEWFKLRGEVRQGSSLWCFQEWLNWYNYYWFPKCAGDEWYLCVHADAICHPETINRHLKIMKWHPDCGWVGSVGMARGGEFSVVWGWRTYECNSSKVEQSIKLYDERVRDTPKDALFVAGNIGRVLKYDELPEQEVFKCAMSATVWTIRPEVLRLGCQMTKWGEEAALGMAIQMAKKWYYCYCDKLSPFTHINGDGSEERIAGRWHPSTNKFEVRRKGELLKPVVNIPIKQPPIKPVVDSGLPTELELMVNMVLNGEIQRCKLCNSENAGSPRAGLVLNYWKQHYQQKHPHSEVTATLK